MSLTEVWKPVVGHEGQFEVSNTGQVKALAHSIRHWCGRMIPRPERIVSQSRHSGGYMIVALRDKKKHYVHRLVAAAFHGQAAHQQDVNHIDGNKTNNSVENLEYCDRLHNVHHAIATGLQDNSGEGNGMSKYRAEQIRLAYDFVKAGSTYGEASLATGVDKVTIGDVVNGKRWKCLQLEPIT